MKCQYKTNIIIVDGYDEDTMIELNLLVNYTFNPGTPESGRFGPVENYDPGSGDEVVIDEKSIKIYDAGVERGEPLELPQWLAVVIAQKLTDSHEEIMAEEARDEE